jgi:hypothetical protein
MRRFLPAAAFLLIAACTDAGSTQNAPQAPAAALTGRYRALSDTAQAITGNVTIEHGGLIFDKGVVIYTRTLNPRRGADLIARNGDSYAAVAVGPGELTIELRRVREQALTGGAQGLCAPQTPTYVALAYQERATSVTVLVFSGEEPPGPQATQSQLCATFAYAVPDGARTRQGVVLQ